ncbi:BZ3500_MvSof-1268-A1-R1_Chr6-3g09009 [Microbotryum saponariae]|uniref:BZ3500_MvSof-1268-A1-R1_Chr6-3g09009 protein n=1 Tax=Microbotryum saponariae TaxID=289078 RepID=A0A2X0LKF9_9BASI|nr:BZ3500_MvSof-1268-A1-R1_Chr6-3g09009 [Microbotryum saponariae]SDA07611.1 BZ3501_MvSof-1269-A2-R1_Chr6-2g08713 [Microbotryum saponariae]
MKAEVEASVRPTQKAMLWTGFSTNQLLVQDLGTLADPTRVPLLTVKYFIRLDSISGKDAKGAALQSFSSRFTFTAAQQQDLKGVAAAAKVTTTATSATASTSLVRSTFNHHRRGVPLIAQIVANATGTTVNTNTNTTKFSNTTTASASAKAKSGSELRFVLSGGISGLVMGGGVAILGLSKLF